MTKSERAFILDTLASGKQKASVGRCAHSFGISLVAVATGVRYDFQPEWQEVREGNYSFAAYQLCYVKVALRLGRFVEADKTLLHELLAELSL